MSASIYITAETKISNEWKLFSPMTNNSDWDGLLFPPLIIDGGWPLLVATIINHNKNWSVPEDSSTDFKKFHDEFIKGKWSFGWSLYSKMKKITSEVGLNKETKFSSLLKHHTINKDNLRLLYWWS